MTSLPTRSPRQAAAPDGPPAPAPPGQGPAAVVSVTGLRKRFGRRDGSVLALDDVDLTLAPGSLHGLLGRNGAGKSTLLRVLLGLVSRDGGEVLVRGADPGRVVGAVPGLAGFVDSPRFYPTLSGRKNLQLLAALDGGSASERLEGALETVGLQDRARHKVASYSTGMRQRLGLAALLLRDPTVLLLDEPTTGLDPAAVHDLHQLLVRLAGQGCAVLLSSHDMSEVEQLCDTVTVLHEGRVAHSGSLARLRREAGAPRWRLRTSDDDLARALAATRLPVEPDDAERTEVAPGLLVQADQDGLDRLVLDLALRGIAVRALSRHDTPLETLFLRMTTPDRTRPERS